MKKLPQKALLAAIILSCGLVTHAETSSQRAEALRTKVATERAWLRVPAAEPSRQDRLLALNHFRNTR